MQNIIRDRWGVAHIDKSEARMPRLLQGYVICDACFADDEWDKATNGMIRLTFSGVRPASPLVARLNLQPGDIYQTEHVGKQLAAIMAERQPLQLVAPQDNRVVTNNAVLSPEGTMAIGMAAAIGSAFAAIRVAREHRCDFDYTPRRPPPISVPHFLKQHREPSVQEPRADRLPFPESPAQSPRSPAAQSEHAPSIRSCSQADVDVCIEELQELLSPSPPSSPAARSDYSPSVCTCSQAGDDDWGCNDDSAYNSSAADADQEYARADDGDSSDGGLL